MAETNRTLFGVRVIPKLVEAKWNVTILNEDFSFLIRNIFDVFIWYCFL